MSYKNLTWLAVLVGMLPVQAQQVTRRANINGNAVDGTCTVEVIVDGAAEVEIQGDQGRLRNLSGQPAVWRRFECNGRMPANPGDFRFRGIDGRGDVRLLQDPRQNGGRIVFQINDPQGGREGYTVDLEWRTSNRGQWNSQDNRGWRGPDYRGGGAWRDPGAGPAPIGSGADDRTRRYYYDGQGRWNQAGTARAVELCQTAAAGKLAQDGFPNVSFQNVMADNNPGRNDFVIGRATARQGFMRRASFSFSCSVNLANGRVRTVEVVRQ